MYSPFAEKVDSLSPILRFGSSPSTFSAIQDDLQLRPLRDVGDLVDGVDLRKVGGKNRLFAPRVLVGRDHRDLEMRTGGFARLLGTGNPGRPESGSQQQNCDRFHVFLLPGLLL